MTCPVALTPLEPWIAAKIDCAGGALKREALRSYQLAKLNQTLSLVQERSPHYQRLLGKERIALSSLEDLAGLPFSTAAQLSSAPFEFLCVRQDEVERIVTLPTSGTTGPPKRIHFTADDQELTRDFFHWGMSTMVEAGDRVLILLPGSLPGSVGDLLNDGLARMGVEGIPHGPVTDSQHTLEVICKERVTALVGIPVQVLWLAQLSAAQGTYRPKTVKSVLLSTDRVPQVVATTIEKAWGCAVYNHYGMTEMGLGGGVDCRARASYHLREADLLFEVVDPVSGKPVPEGETGEVVFTTLTRRAMPLVRYRTGDVSRFIPQPCHCGTVLKRLAHIDERLAGGIDLAGGGVIRQRDFDEALFATGEVADFRTYFTKESGAGRLVLRARGCDASRRPDKEAIVQTLLTIPQLSSEVARGALSVEVLDWDADDHSGNGTAKRATMLLHETRGQE
jgi:phenylacetate-CoA ligase